MKIRVNRQSVCMGDDVDDHSKVYELEETATYEDLFNSLKKDKYFPSVSGNNVVWVLTTSKTFCIFSYFTLREKFSTGLTEKKLQKICDSSDEVYLRYYSNPKRWKEKIYSMYNGDEYTMWRDGWMEEIKYCDYISDKIV